MIKTHPLNITALTIAFGVVAQSAHAQEYAASLEAHVHGLSELTTVIAGVKYVKISFQHPR